MRRHLSEFSKSPLDVPSPAARRLASRGPASGVRGGAPPLRSRPLSVSSPRPPEQFIAVQYVRSANFFTRLKFVVSCKMRI